MIYNEIHTIRDQNQMIRGAQLTGVTKEFDERPDYVCILENADGTYVCSEWLTDDEFKFTRNNQVGINPYLLILIIQGNYHGK